jgi:hypothetical protein
MHANTTFGNLAIFGYQHAHTIYFVFCCTVLLFGTNISFTYKQPSYLLKHYIYFVEDKQMFPIM